MTKRQATLLMAFILTLAGAPASYAGDGIATTTAADGRKVFINNADSPHPATADSREGVVGESPAAPPVHYIYWSNTQRRWKPVPMQSAAARRARAAAAEVIAATQSASPDAAADPAVNTFTSERVNAAIELAAARNNVDPNLVRAVIKVESNFNPRAVSRKGAMGLMQLMPSTARSLRVAHPFDPTENIDAGVRHLKQLMENFGGDLKLSLAAYNAGAGAVQRHNGVPPYAETQAYVRQITSLYRNANLLPGARPITVSRDAEGHLLFSNTE
jgi:soluble lytic murein transglycosylase-like protein